MDLTLVRVTPDGESTPVRVSKERTTIGRDTACQIRVPAVDVSRKHCEIVTAGDAVIVQDLGSRNGTLVNGERVDTTELKVGDVLTVGPLVFVVQIDGTPGEIDALKAYSVGAAEAEAKKAAKAAPQKAAPQKATPERSGSLGGGLMDDIAPGMDPDDSSVVEFDFDFGDEDEDDQPPL